MKIRRKVRIISYIASVFLIMCGFLWVQQMELDAERLKVENQYVKNLNILESSLNNITDTLNKASYMRGGSDLLSLSTNLFCEGETAKNALASLPSGEERASTLYKFLSQVGNYAVTISKNAVDGEISDSESQNISELYSTSSMIAKVVEDVNRQCDNIEDFAKIMNDKIDKKVDYDTLASKLDGLEKQLNDYPTLIYDGPFSDHLLKKAPIMTSNAAGYSKKSCLKRAKEIFGNEYDFRFTGEQDGKIKCFRYEAGDMTCCITINGGYAAYMRNSRQIGEEKIKPEQAVDYAKRFLEKNGLKNMEETYYYAVDGECTINFAYQSGDTLCYTDLIKTGVALDTGEIVFYEAYGYLSNHTNRPFEAPTHSVEEAQKAVDNKLTVTGSKLCLIPTDSGGEVRCYEFVCETPDKQKTFVYVSVKQLNTVKILLVEESAAGVLVR